MVSQELVSYVKRMLSSGYSAESIRNALFSAGYRAGDIDDALREATAKRVVFGGKLLVISIIALVFLFGMLLVGIKLLMPEAKTISVSLSASKQQASPGEAIGISAVFSSNQSRSVLVSAHYSLIGPAGENLFTRQEKFSVGKSAVKSVQFAIPANATTGDYSVLAVANYDGKVAEARISLKIAEKKAAAPAPGEALSAPERRMECGNCDDFNPCTRDYCDKGICRNEPVSPCCGNGICEQGESQTNCPADCVLRAVPAEQLTEKAKKAVLGSVEAGATICASIPTKSDADICFSEIAGASRNSALCGSIQDAGIRDDCLMNFALMDDFSVCEKMSSPYFMNSCFSLQRMKQLAARQ